VEEGVTAAAERNQSAVQQRRFWILVSVLAGALALLKGIRLPNRWAATRSQIDYSQGFVKRGFFGQFVAGPLGLGHYARFAAVSFVLLFLLCFALAMLARRSGLVTRVGGAEIVAVFCGCYGVSVLASTVGYFDVVLALLATIVLFVKNVWLRLFAGLIAVALGVLIHEMFLFAYAPVLALTFFLQGASTKKPWVVAGGVFLLVVAGLLALKVSDRRQMSGLQADAMRAHVRSRIDFEARSDAFDVLNLSAADNRFIMSSYYRSFDWKIRQVSCVLLFGPVVTLLIWTALKVLSVAHAGRSMAAFTVLAALSPLMMHMYAWDVVRFNALLCFTAFLALLAVVQFYPGPALAASATRQRVAGIVLLVSIGSGGGLMWRSDKMFPAYPELKKFKNQIHEMTLAQIANVSD
jgi:hypothetical protein